MTDDHSPTDDFGSTGTEQDDRTITADGVRQRPAERLPDSIGRYRIVGKLGAGCAYQKPRLPCGFIHLGHAEYIYSGTDSRLLMIRGADVLSAAHPLSVRVYRIHFVGR
jgi:hypothetical protein